MGDKASCAAALLEAEDATRQAGRGLRAGCLFAVHSPHELDQFPAGRFVTVEGRAVRVGRRFGSSLDFVNGRMDDLIVTMSAHVLRAFAAGRRPPHLRGRSLRSCGVRGPVGDGPPIGRVDVARAARERMRQ